MPLLLTDDGLCVGPPPALAACPHHEAVNALTVARAQVDLIRRHSARGGLEPIDLDAALLQIRESLDRLGAALGVLDAADGSRPVPLAGHRTVRAIAAEPDD